MLMWPRSTPKPSSSWPTTQINPGNIFIAGTCSLEVNLVATGQLQDHLISIAIGDQVEVLEK